MEIKIKFSTGKEITLNQIEFNELMNRHPYSYVPYPTYPVYPNPYNPTWITSDATQPNIRLYSESTTND